MFIDTHCHFDFPIFTDHIKASIDRIKAADIRGLIIPAITADRFSTILDLANRYQPIYAALGLHPIYKHSEEDLQILTEKLAAKPDKLVAIGEVGLDRFIFANLDNQEEIATKWQKQCYFFREQLKLAKRFDLPLLIHSRKAADVIHHELRQANLPCRGVLHGFSGSYEQAMQFVKLGYYIGVGGVISYPRAQKTRNAIARLPLTSLLLETDAPDMPLNGEQSRPNRPENIVLIFKILTELRSETAAEISEQILTNTLTLFGRINKMVLSHP
ncbi:TatD family hydrolase [Orbaceae bacterium ESL0721]|nr:TatD family hydrolase [Orbaceae bacterium ESL0721]